MCGLPSSGKSSLVNQLVEYFKNELKKNVIVINDSIFTTSEKNSIYEGKSKIS